MAASPRMLVPWRHAAAIAAITLSVAAAYAGLRDAPPIATFESQTLGWRFQLRGSASPPDSVAVVALDDRTLARFNAWPLPRKLLAEAVAAVDAAGATAIGLDLLLLEPEGLTSSAGDRALREALLAAENAVLGMAFTFGPADEASTAADALAASAFKIVRRDAADAPLPRPATGALLPAAPFRDLQLGHVNVPVDEGSSLQRLALAIGFADVHVPGFPVALAARHLGVPVDELELQLGRGQDRRGPGVAIGERFVPADPALRMVLNSYGPTGTVPTHSLVDLLDGRLPEGALAGRVVIIGATALGVGDTFATPFSGELPGAEALATAAANMIDGRVLIRDLRTAQIDIAAILLLGVAIFLLAQLPSPAAAAIAGIGLLFGWLAVAQLAFETRQLWLDVTFPSLAVLLNAAWVAAGRLAFEHRLRGVAERQRQNLSRYHSPLIAEVLAEDEAAALDGRTQPAAILFIDVAGFTGRSARMGPEGTARFLRDFHGRVEQAVLRHGGVLEQFTGDGAMVIFGVPRQSRDDAAAALACGRELAAAVERWSAELVAAGEPPVSVGVGIHYGPVVIARLGGREQIQLTAAGETVNLASRLEALTRAHHAAIVVSETLADTVRGLGRAELLTGFEELAPQAVRGLDRPVAVWVLRQLAA